MGICPCLADVTVVCSGQAEGVEGAEVGAVAGAEGVDQGQAASLEVLQMSPRSPKYVTSLYRIGLLCTEGVPFLDVWQTHSKRQSIPWSPVTSVFPVQLCLKRLWWMFWAHSTRVIASSILSRSGCQAFTSYFVTVQSGHNVYAPSS